MKNTFSKQRNRKIFVRVFSVTAIAIIMLLVVQSCSKEHLAEPNSEAAITASNADPAVTSITKQQALARLNEHFKNEFSTINMEQVHGVTKQQFTQWLRNSKMAPAEDIIRPLLSTNNQQYIILKNITVRATGKLASVGLIGTTPPFYEQFTRMVAVVNYNNILIGNRHICDWKKCDSYSPCPCITWIDMVIGDCPTDKCIYNSDCQGYNPATDCDGELTGIKTIDAIAAF